MVWQGRTGDRPPYADSRREDAVECENPECPFRNSLRRRLLGSTSEGVLMQGRWYCSADCFEQAITQEFARLVELRDEPLLRIHRVPLGLLLLGRRVITDEQLKTYLAAQRESSASGIYW